jgi:lysophospholipase L1-like esterase
MEQIMSNRKLLCIGASNTYGHDPRSYLGSRYPAQIRWTDRLPGRDVINCGVNGMTVPREASVFCDAVRSNAPDLVVVMLGTNDLLEGMCAEQIAERMEAFLVSLQETGVPILLVAPPHMQSGEWIQSDALKAESLDLRRRYRALAAKAGCRFADAGAWDIDMTFDGVHFSPTGHAAFAQRLEECITC